DLKAGLLLRLGDGGRALAGLHGAIVVTRETGVRGQVGVDPAETLRIIESVGQRHGVRENREDLSMSPQRQECVAEIETDVDRFRESLAGLRQMTQNVQGLFEKTDGFTVRRSSGRPRRRLSQVREGLVPEFTAERVV